MRAFVAATDADRFTGEFACVRAARVAALASEATSLAADEHALRQHARLAARVHDRVASLPARFGLHYPSADALADALAAREDALVRELEALGDRVELSIVLTWRVSLSQTDSPPRTGRDYLVSRVARAREEREAESLVARLVDVLAIERALARQSICPRPGIAATVAVLVTRDGEADVRERSRMFEETTDKVTVSVYGPLPPYSFAS